MNEHIELLNLDLPALVRRVVDGDGQSSVVLVRLLGPTVRAKVRSALKGEYACEFEDVVQEAWLRVFKSLRHWRGTGLFAYVSAVSYSAAMDAVRPHLNRPRSELFIDDESNQSGARSDESQGTLDSQYELEQLRLAVQQITDVKLRQVFHLRLEDKTFEEIGRELKRSEAWARLAWNRILDQLLRAIVEARANTRHLKS